VTAFLLEPVTAENFAQGILSVLDEPALAQKLRTNVQSFVLGRFDWPSIAVRLEAVYGSLLENRVPYSVDPSRAKRATDMQAPLLSR
jgi:glycosyltransferase involved in cell wall biosynthesis